MPKHIYCSKCGVELVQSRQVVRGTILDMVDPHECEGYAIKANEDENPTVLDIIEGLKELSQTIEKVEDDAEGSANKPLAFPLSGDKREGVKTSTAPASLSNAIKNGEL